MMPPFRLTWFVPSWPVHAVNDNDANAYRSTRSSGGPAGAHHCNAAQHAPANRISAYAGARVGDAVSQDVS